MKNFLCYTNPSGEFSEENKTLVKIHIDNSYDLGWKREDILLFTNFPYSYNGVRSIYVSEKLDLHWDRTSNKIFVIEALLKANLLDKDLYWYHDFDAYQNDRITEEELGLGDYDIGLTTYGYKDQINGGSFFFRENTTDFFIHWAKRLQDICRTRADEKTMTDMTRNGELDRFKYKILNITYNFGQRCPHLCYQQADKPLKILHFHPYYQFYPRDKKNIDVFMHGQNRQGFPMMSDRLAKIFREHGIK